MTKKLNNPINEILTHKDNRGLDTIGVALFDIKKDEVIRISVELEWRNPF